MRKTILGFIAVVTVIAATSASAAVIWEDPFADASNWTLDNLIDTPLGGALTQFDLDSPALNMGAALRVASPELLPFYLEGVVTNQIRRISANGAVPFAAVRLYVETYSQETRDPLYLVESQVIQSLTTSDTIPAELVSSLSDFTWATSGGELPGWLNFRYELIGPPQTELTFVADHLSYSVIPEPGTLLIGGILAGLSGWTVRRRKKTA